MHFLEMWQAEKIGKEGKGPITAVVNWKGVHEIQKMEPDLLDPAIVAMMKGCFDKPAIVEALNSVGFLGAKWRYHRLGHIPLVLEIPTREEESADGTV